MWCGRRPASVRAREDGASLSSESAKACTSPSVTVVSGPRDEREEAIDVGAVRALSVR
jgi:hypothetical protein